MLFGIKFVFALLVELLRVLILICVLSVFQVFFPYRWFIFDYCLF